MNGGSVRMTIMVSYSLDATVKRVSRRLTAWDLRWDKRNKFTKEATRI